MKTPFPLRVQILPLNLKPALAGLQLVLLTALPLPAADRPVLNSPPPVPDLIRMQLGTIGVLSPASPAQTGFTPGNGQITDASDHAGVAARQALDAGSGAFSPAVFVAGSVLRTVAAPVYAAAAARSARKHRLAPADLAECERAVSAELARLATQPVLRNAFLAAARQKTRRNLVPLPSAHSGAVAPEPVETLLELSLDEFTLHRTGSKEESLALLIKARAKLKRMDDGAVLYDEPFSYQSGTGLFYDYAMNNAQALRDVAETGFRKLCENLVDQLFAARAEGPVIVKAGQKSKPSRLASIAKNGSGMELQPVAHRNPSLGTLEIITSSAVAGVASHQPPNKQEAVSEVVQDTEYLLHDFLESHNLVVMLIGGAVAIPTSLALQVHHDFLAVPDQKLKAAGRAMTPVLQHEKPAQTLGASLARELVGQSALQVVYHNERVFPGERRPLIARRPASGNGTRANGDLPVAAFPPGADNDRTVEIEVFSAGLKGKTGLNPRLALNMDVRVSVMRTRDGREMFSCPVQYRSPERTYGDWAAHDARLFRQELESCYGELTRAVVAQLAERGILAPPSDGTDPAVLAAK